ncbi:hypothetical protein [Streptomyces niveiscabiei]|uniref:Uncharacterized protein n=1 Tax=Streptomyces niveiscabiei TaxID=164115 RepID=A0ABW9HIQ1_9ACTN
MDGLRLVAFRVRPPVVLGDGDVSGVDAGTGQIGGEGEGVAAQGGSADADGAEVAGQGVYGGGAGGEQEGAGAAITRTGQDLADGGGAVQAVVGLVLEAGSVRAASSGPGCGPDVLSRLGRTGSGRGRAGVLSR